MWQEMRRAIQHPEMRWIYLVVFVVIVFSICAGVLIGTIMW